MYKAKGSGEQREQQLLWLLPFLQGRMTRGVEHSTRSEGLNSAPQISMVFLYTDLKLCFSVSSYVERG